MSAIDVLKAVGHDAVEAALDHWRGVDPSTREAVLAGMDLALAGGLADAETLVGIRRAVEAGSKGVLEIASYVASVLIDRDKAAFPLISDLAASPTTQGRIGALLCMPPQTPDDLIRPILGALLKDRSKKVREMAIEWIRRHDLKQFLPMLELLLADESDQAIKEHAELAVGLVKNGYHVRRSHGQTHVTIKMKVGIYRGVVDSDLARGLSDREIAERFATSASR